MTSKGSNGETAVSWVLYEEKVCPCVPLLKSTHFCHAMGFPTRVETKPYPEIFRNGLAKPGLVKCVVSWDESV